MKERYQFVVWKNGKILFQTQEDLPLPEAKIVAVSFVGAFSDPDVYKVECYRKQTTIVSIGLKELL